MIDGSFHRVRRRTAATLLLLACAAPRPASAFSGAPSSRSAGTAPRRAAAAPRPPLAFDARVARAFPSPLPSSSSSALSAAFLPQAAAAGAVVARFYKASPLVAGFLTTSTKAALADSMAQYRDACTTRFDARRNFAMVLYSGVVLGVLCEVMYNRVFPLLFGGAGPGVSSAIKMTLFDGFVNAPLIWLPPAYLAKALVYRYSVREAVEKYVADVRDNGLLRKYWKLWLPASMINFLVVPTHFRILFVAAVSFFWMIMLSIVSNNASDSKSCPVPP